MEGDALAKQMTGARVIAMAEDVPALAAMKPGGKRHPIDEVITDGDTVSLGDITLTAHLTAGHTPGCRVPRAAGVQSEMELAFAGVHQLCAPTLDCLDTLPEPPFFS